MNKSIMKISAGALAVLMTCAVMSCKTGVDGTTVNPGDVVSTGIKIGETTLAKTSEVVIVPTGTTGVVDMKDDSSWNTYVAESASLSYRGVFIKGRKVILSPYVMSQYEVTQELYEAVLKTDADCNATLSIFNTNADVNEIQKFRPVENVTWYDAVYFCNALTKLTMTEDDCVYTITDVERIDTAYRNIISAKVTQDLTKKGYRLPTAAEWEYAARGGNPQAEAWKNAYGKVTIMDNTKIYTGEKYIYYDENIESVGWYYGNSSNKTHEVGLKAENSLNLYDIIGNVFEWCWDWFQNSFPAGTVTNPCGVDNGTTRVMRGGDYSGYASGNTVSINNARNPYNHYGYLGFRVCRSSSK